MKKLIIIAIIFVIALFAGCKLSSNKDLNEFPISRSLILTDVNIKPDVVAIPTEISIHKDMIIVWDEETDWFFKIFSLDDFEYLGCLVRRGKGPEEEIDIAPFIRPYANDAILYQGTGNVKIATVQKKLNELEMKIIEVYDLPVEMYDDVDFFFLNEKLYSSFALRPVTKEFQGFCPESGKLFEWGELLPINTSKRPTTIILFKLTTVKPDNQRLAIAYNLLPIVRIYDAESGILLNELKNADSSENERILTGNSSNQSQKGLVNYYFRVKSTNEYIYALYSGKPTGGNAEFNEIHIWDWDGNPVMKLNLSLPLESFDVSKDNKHIFAISLFESDKLFIAEIPWD